MIRRLKNLFRGTSAVVVAVLIVSAGTALFFLFGFILAALGIAVVVIFIAGSLYLAFQDDTKKQEGPR